MTITLPLSRFVRNLTGLSRKLGSNQIDECLVTRSGKPYLRVSSVRAYEQIHGALQAAKAE